MPREADAHAKEPVYWLERLTSGGIAVLLLVAPIKFASVVNSAGVSLYPTSFELLIIGTWPPFVLPIITSLLLALALLRTWQRQDGAAVPLLLFGPPALLIAVAGLGMFWTTELDGARQFVLHLASCLQLALAAWLQVQAHSRWRKQFFVCMLLGATMSCLLGWAQVKGGLAMNSAQIKEMAKIYNWQLPDLMVIRMNSRRVYSTFTVPNSFAAHLLLLYPLIIALAVVIGRRGMPPIACVVLLVVTISTFWLVPFYHAGSRGAMLGAVGGIGLSALFGGWTIRKRIKRLRLWVGLLLVLGFAMGIAGHRVSKGRGMRSAEARLDYFAAAGRMFAQQPLTGVGTGEFYPWYMRLKPAGAEETRMPHNLFLLYLAETGVAGGLAALIFLLWPLVLAEAWRRGRLETNHPELAAGVLIGLLAWCCHSLFDFNIRTPATVMLVFLLPALLFKPKAVANSAAPRWIWAVATLSCLIAICAIQRIPAERAYAAVAGSGFSFGAVQAPPPYAQVRANVLRNERVFGTWPYPWERLARLAIQNRDLDTAVLAFERAIECAPHRGGFHSGLANIYLATGDLAAAKRENALALTWYPYNPRYLAQKTVVDAQLRAAKSP